MKKLKDFGKMVISKKSTVPEVIDTKIELSDLERGEKMFLKKEQYYCDNGP